MKKLKFEFNVIQLDELQIDELYQKFPEIEDPAYPKEVIGNSPVVSDKEYVWLKMTIDNEHYFCQSFPAYTDLWYKIIVD